MYNFCLDNKMKYKQLRKLICNWIVSIYILDEEDTTKCHLVKRNNTKYDDLYVLEVFSINKEKDKPSITFLDLGVSLSKNPYWDGIGKLEKIELTPEFIRRKFSRVLVQYSVKKAVLYYPLSADKWDFEDAIEIGIDGDLQGWDIYGLGEELKDVLDIAVSVDYISDPQNNKNEYITLFKQKRDPATNEVLSPYKNINDDIKIDFKVGKTLQNLMIEAEEIDLTGEDWEYDNVVEAIWVYCKNANGDGKMTEEQWHTINARYPF